ncbi:HAD family hydrolase [Phyllobacterium leguminum]|uniref:phosphoglycolate phosphatase n=1 Tax=Phyllobacterium leguminum TaxID=314237 RepID=A0A318T7Z6_9HYPH|nr:HAD family hydrolase [Phyllobacterium leguminum]PYE86686.1 phosphoglycolate phosphatase [Phyllobacterium leguminum]
MLSKIKSSYTSRFGVFIFDYDGTLAATRTAVIKCFSQTLRERFATIPMETIEAVIASGGLLEDAFARLMPGFTNTDIRNCVSRYREIYIEIDQETTVLFEGVKETLTALHREGRKIVVLSNKGRVSLETGLERFNLTHLITAILPADQNEPTKPNPEVFFRRVRPLFGGIPLSSFIMIGDTFADIAFARASNIASCWVSYGYGDAIQCLSMRPDFVIGSLRELLPSGRHASTLNC